MLDLPGSALVRPPNGSADGWLAMPALRFPRFWLLAGAAALSLVLLFGIVPVPPALRWLMPDDKVLHALAYAGLSASAAQILLDRRARLLAVGLLLAFGLAIECLQALTVTRQFELLDLAANAAGACLAWRLVGAREGSLLPRLEQRYLRTLGRREAPGLAR